ncbi:MAG: tyrosine-protein phosphatase [Clostridia bacterium]|nr:tyrosine-protein phosphatase [Clostridia bacterium]
MKKRLIVLLLVVVISAMTFVGCDSGSANNNGRQSYNIKPTEIEVKEGVGQVVSLCQDDVAAYVNAMKAIEVENDYCFNDQAGAGVAVKDYWKQGTNVSGGNAVKLTWKASAAPYTVKVWANGTEEDATVYTAKSESLLLINLYMATEYNWSVTDANGNERAVNGFTTADTVRTLFTGYVNNVRDLGGRMTSSGKRVKQGVIYRGAEMNLQTYVDENSAKHYINLRSLELDILNNGVKIKNELDFRTSAETLGMTKSPLGDQVNYYSYPISAYTGMFCKHSSNGADKPEMREYYQNILRLLATASEDNVCYFHCWGGADRTGTIGFLVNGLLGVSYTDLLIDFELTTFSNNYRYRQDDPANYNYFNSMVTQLIENYRLSPDETISTVIERYMKQCLYLTDTDINNLKTNLLEA